MESSEEESNVNLEKISQRSHNQLRLPPIIKNEYHIYNPNITIQNQDNYNMPHISP